MHIDSAQLLRAQNTRVLPTTGDTTVPPGDHRVSETAIAPTSLADYNSSVVCRTGRGGGDVVAQGIGTSLTVPVRSGEHVVCVFLNSHKGAPLPPPEADLAITKVVSQSLASPRSDGHVDRDAEEQRAGDGDKRADRGHAPRRRQVHRGLPVRSAGRHVRQLRVHARVTCGRCVRRRDVPDDRDAGRLPGQPRGRQGGPEDPSPQTTPPRPSSPSKERTSRSSSRCSSASRSCRTAGAARTSATRTRADRPT